MTDRDLTADDVPGCMALSRAAGWNQVPEDWRLVLRAGRARGAVAQGRVVASAAVMPYGAFGWICMVLVAPDARRRGHATRLMGWAMETLEAGGLVSGLDATPEGRAVYGRLGFRDVAALTRWARVGSGVRSEIGVSRGCRRMTDAEFEAVARRDAGIFGEDRGRVLAALRARRPDLALIAGDGGAIGGYCFGRDGELATHVGPVVAWSDGVGQALIDAAMARTGGTAIIDVADRHGGVARALAERGFAARRSFTRMVRSDAAFGMDAAMIAIAGPELG